MGRPRIALIYDDVLGRVTTMTHGNGALAQHDYDADGRLTALRNLKSDSSVISIFTYTYDNVGNRASVVEASGDRATWSYDEAYQLTREQRSGANAYDITYTYDGVGNRETKVESGAATTYSCDAANQLNTSEDASGVTTYTYDANGNTETQEVPNGDLTTYTWDIENHLTKVELPSNVVNTITLDGEGKRRSIEDSAGLRNVIWDTENILAETDSGNSTVAQYTLAPEVYGELVSQRRSGASSFHHFDALGSTDRLTDSGANTLASYLYRAFGQQSVLSGSSANPFTWVGQLGYYRQPDPTDYWIRARIMKPTIGRWLGRDPSSLKEEGNLYMYALNNPNTVLDASGLEVCFDLFCRHDLFWKYVTRRHIEYGKTWRLVKTEQDVGIGPQCPLFGGLAANWEGPGLIPDAYAYWKLICIWERDKWEVTTRYRWRRWICHMICFGWCETRPYSYITSRTWIETQQLPEKRKRLKPQRRFTSSDWHCVDAPGESPWPTKEAERVACESEHRPK